MSQENLDGLQPVSQGLHSSFTFWMLLVTMYVPTARTTTCLQSSPKSCPSYAHCPSHAPALCQALAKEQSGRAFYLEHKPSYSQILIRGQRGMFYFHKPMQCHSLAHLSSPRWAPTTSSIRASKPFVSHNSSGDDKALFLATLKLELKWAPFLATT